MVCARKVCENGVCENDMCENGVCDLHRKYAIYSTGCCS